LLHHRHLGRHPDVSALAAYQGGASFSPRERQVLQLIAEGSSSKQAVSVLGVTKRTIDHHRQNLMRKLGLYSVGELTKFAIRHGLTPVDRGDSD
jgi:DNA-binding NarL/FixJ family response regulator